MSCILGPKTWFDLTGGLTAASDSEMLGTVTLGHQHREFKPHVTTTEVMIGVGFGKPFGEVLLYKGLPKAHLAADQ